MLPSNQKNWLFNKIFWRAKYILKKQTTPTAQQHGFGGNTEKPTTQRTTPRWRILPVDTQLPRVRQSRWQPPSSSSNRPSTTCKSSLVRCRWRRTQCHSNSSNTGSRCNTSSRGNVHAAMEDAEDAKKAGISRPWARCSSNPILNQPNTNFNGSQSGGGGNPPTQQNPYRWYENNNFCDTHGFHVHDGHSSQTCNEPGPNQQANMMGQPMMGQPMMQPMHQQPMMQPPMM